MNTLKRALLCALLSLISSGAALAQTRAPLAMHAKPGQVTRSKNNVSLKVSNNGTSLILQLKQTERTEYTSVAPNGDISFKQTDESLDITANGQTMPAPSNQLHTDSYVVHPDGTLASYKPGDATDKTHTTERVFNATSPIFIDKPVGVGDSWSHSFPANSDMGTHAAKGDYKIEAEEKLDGADTFRISFQYSENDGERPISSKGTLWVEKSSGDTVKTDIQLENVPFGPPQSGAIASGHFVAERTEGSPLGDAKTGGVSSASSTPKLKTIDEEVKGFEKSPGFVTLYRKKTDDSDTIYMEIPESLLDKPILMEVTARTGTSEQIVAGSPIDDLLFKFVKTPDGKLTLVVPNINFRARAGSPLERAVKRSFADSELENFRIKATQPDRKSILIDVSDLFKGDIAQVSDSVAGSSLASLLGGGGSYIIDHSKTYVTLLKNFPKDLLVETHYNFNKVGRVGSGGLAALLSGSGQTLADDRSFPVTVDYTVFPLPTDNGYMPRLADPRIGYFQVEHQDMDDDSKSDQSIHYIYRWHIVKADPKAALSKPVKPIVFWLDNAIPIRYRTPVREALLFWNRAFEKIGIQDAIEVKQMPDDAHWDQADMRYNVVRWVVSPSSGYAVSEMRVNPLTGQILNADITVDANLVRFTRLQGKLAVQPISSYFDELTQPLTPGQLLADKLQDKFCDMPAESISNAWLGSMAIDMLEPAGLAKSEEPAYVDDYLRSVVSHEMGHILGLRHNFIASTYHTLNQLKSEKIIQNTGMTASVMDYFPFNISAIRQKDVDYWTPRIGPYDEWAIKYGYLPIPAATTPVGELYTLHQIASDCNEPGHIYESDEIADQFDPNVTRFDLGTDPMLYWHKMLDLTRFLMLNLYQREPQKGHSYWKFTRDFNSMIRMHVQAASEIGRYIGGLHVNRNFRGDYGEKPTLVPISRATQEDALHILCSYLLSANALKFPSDYYTHFTPNPNAGFVLMLQRQDYPIFDTLSSAQQSLLGYLFSPVTLGRIVNNEFKVGDKKTLPLTALFHTVSAAVWSELKEGGDIDALQRQVQRKYLSLLTDMLTNTSNPAPADAKMLAWHQLKLLSSEIADALKKPHNEFTRIHLAESLMLINRALNAQQTVGAPASSGGISLLSALLGGEAKQSNK